eukprot:3469439-Pyramimonas_sp.AAC.3
MYWSHATPDVNCQRNPALKSPIDNDIDGYACVSSPLLLPVGSNRRALVDAMTVDGKPPGLLGKAACGIAGGGFGAVIGSPADLSLIRMQTDSQLPVGERRGYRHAGDALVRFTHQWGLPTAHAAAPRKTHGWNIETRSYDFISALRSSVEFVQALWVCISHRIQV